MDITIVILIILIIGLGLLAWQLASVQKRFNFYNDYVKSVRQEVLADVVTDQFLEELRNHARLEIQKTIDAMDGQLREQMSASYGRLLQSIEQTAAEIINKELEQYRQTIAEARQAATGVTTETKDILEQVRTGAEQQALTAIREEKKVLLEKLDVKLQDIMSYYLLEALGEHVDLGAQKSYIMSQLEAHKDEIKKDINDQF